MRRSQEGSSPNFLWRWKQAQVVRLAAQRICETILQVTSKSVDYEILSSEKGSLRWSFLKRMKLSSKWREVDEVQRWDTCPGIRNALDWMDRINLNPRFESYFVDSKKPSPRHSDQWKFFTRRMESSSFFFNIMSFFYFSCCHVTIRLENKALSKKKKIRADFKWRLSDDEAETSNSGEDETIFVIRSLRSDSETLHKVWRVWSLQGILTSGMNWK